MVWFVRTVEHLNRARAEWLAAGACLAGVVAIASFTSPTHGLGAALALIGLFVGGFLSIVIHEAGHAICAWLVGWRVWVISAAPVSWRLGHGPRFSTRLSGDVGGFVLASPPTEAHDSRWRSIVFSAGGPLASLIAGPVFIYWLTTFPPGAWETPHTAGLLGAALALGFHSAYAAAFTIWPWKSGSGAPNDMLMILSALFGPMPASHARALIWAEALFAYGVEPSAWPSWGRQAVTDGARTPNVAALRFAMALEAGDLARAQAIADHADDDAAKVMRAYLLAMAGQAADDMLAAIGDRTKIAVMAHWRSLALALIQAHTGAQASARLALDDFAEALAEHPTPHPFWQARLQQARDVLTAKAVSPSPRLNQAARHLH
jgi:hypothetical protein